MKKIKVNRRIYIALSKVFEKLDRETVLEFHKQAPYSWRGVAEPLNGMPLEQLQAIADYSYELDEPKKISSAFTEFLESLKNEDAKKSISVSVALGRALDYVLKEHNYDNEEVLFVHTLVKGEYVGQTQILNGVKYSDLKTILENGFHYENREDGKMEKRFFVTVKVEQALDYLLYERELTRQEIYTTHKKKEGTWMGAAAALNNVSSELVKQALEQDYCSLDTRWDGELIVVPQAAAKSLDVLFKKCRHSKDFILKRHKKHKKYSYDSEFATLVQYLDTATLKKALTYGYVANGAGGKQKVPVASKNERETHLDKRGLEELKVAFSYAAFIANDREWMQELMNKGDK